VFFVFAKKSTKQKYQIYVGPGFTTDTVKNIVGGIRVTDTNIRYIYEPWDEMPWKQSIKMLPGDVMEIEVDFSQKLQATIKNKLTTIDLDPNPSSATNSDTCKPESFCKWSGSQSCVSSLKADDPRYKVSDQTCKEWAVKDLDCPEAGCLGFSFTLPAGFKADDKNHRQMPEAVEDKTTGLKAPWKDIPFQPPKNAADAGDCAYSKIPGTSQCTVSDCGNGMGNPPFCDKPAIAVR
jgi:hypothetical protein